MTLVEKRIKFLHMIGELLAFARKEQISLICYGFWRSDAEQAKFLAAGTSTVKRSKHQDWLAMDFAVMREDDSGAIIPIWNDCEEYRLLGEEWESLGGTWGGRWKTPHDPFHFQL